jgi:MraZ protein
MDILSGEFFNTLDEKGRIGIPARLRERLPGNLLYITKGAEKCVWIFTPDEWDRSYELWMRNSAQSARRRSAVVHRFVAPRQDVEIDKAHRIMIPQSLREYAGLVRDCVVVGIGETIEVWDQEEYRRYQSSLDSEIDEVMSETSSADFYG